MARGCISLVSSPSILYHPETCKFKYIYPMTEHDFSLILVFFPGWYWSQRDDIKGLEGWYGFSRDDMRFSQSWTAGTIQLLKFLTNEQPINIDWYWFPPIRSNFRDTPPKLNWPMKCCCYQFVLFKTMTNLGFLVCHERHQFKWHFLHKLIYPKFPDP